LSSLTAPRRAGFAGGGVFFGAALRFLGGGFSSSLSLQGGGTAFFVGFFAGAFRFLAGVLSSPTSFSYLARRPRSGPRAMTSAPDASTFSASRASADSCAASQFFALISHSLDFTTRA